MKIGITGPISTESIRGLLFDQESKLPEGMGGAPFLGTLIKGLLLKGHEVSAYTLDRTISHEDINNITAEGNNFKIYYGCYRPHSFRSNGTHKGRMLDFFKVERESILKAIYLDKPDVVHAHWTYEFGSAALDCDLPYLITCHDSPLKVIRYMPSLYRLGRLFMARNVLKKAKYLSAVSPYLKSELKFFTSNNIEVIANPAPYSVFENRKNNLDLRKLEQPDIIMINNGWGKLKNVSAGIIAFNEFLKSYPNSNLHLVGYDFERGGKAEEWAFSNGYSNNIVFHGPVEHDKLLTLLSRSTVLLHTALEESCPLTLIEAMTSGIPIIGGIKSGGVPWILDNGKAGIVTDITKPQEICSSLLDLVCNNELYTTIHNVGIERSQALFSPAGVSTMYEMLYEKII